MTVESGLPLESRIRTTLLNELLTRDSFRREFEQIEKDVRDELETTLDARIAADLADPTTPNRRRAHVIARSVVKDLSDRRGLRQGYFDQLFYDGRSVRGYMRRNPGVVVSEDQSRTGVTRILSRRVQHVLRSSNP